MSSTSLFIVCGVNYTALGGPCHQHTVCFKRLLTVQVVDKISQHSQAITTTKPGNEVNKHASTVSVLVYSPQMANKVCYQVQEDIVSFQEFHYITRFALFQDFALYKNNIIPPEVQNCFTVMLQIICKVSFTNGYFCCIGIQQTHFRGCAQHGRQHRKITEDNEVQGVHNSHSYLGKSCRSYPEMKYKACTIAIQTSVSLAGPMRKSIKKIHA